ncbi:MAG: YciI family protein [Aquihabitans sp.]
MKTVLLYESSDDVMTLAPIHFPAHKARIDAFQARGILEAIGPFADPRDGAMGIFTSREAAEEFVADDPFVLEGVVSGHRILEWHGETPLPRSLADG